MAGQSTKNDCKDSGTDGSKCKYSVQYCREKSGDEIPSGIRWSLVLVLYTGVDRAICCWDLATLPGALTNGHERQYGMKTSELHAPIPTPKRVRQVGTYNNDSMLLIRTKDPL